MPIRNLDKSDPLESLLLIDSGMDGVSPTAGDPEFYNSPTYQLPPEVSLYAAILYRALDDLVIWRDREARWHEESVAESERNAESAMRWFLRDSERAYHAEAVSFETCLEVLGISRSSVMKHIKKEGLTYERQARATVEV